MRFPRRSISLAACLLALAVPSGALAQTPGDDQYTDPFGGSQDEGAGAPPSSGDEEPPAAAPAPAPAAPAPAAPAPATPDAAPEASAAQQLPYTGVDAGLVFASGTLLLAGGIALRLRLRAG